MEPHDSYPQYSDEHDGSDHLSGPHQSRSPTSSSHTPPLDSPQDSLDDYGHVAAHDRTRKSHRSSGHRHSTNREFMKLLVSEEAEAKQTRKFLRSALARLDNETIRAQEAEKRALELAERFKIVNDARIQAQQELQRVNEELRLYKVQYDNAQREILRGQELLKALEAQRDDAETHAAKARSTARRLKEENLMMRAREEGRRAGYAEGLRRGLEQARMHGLRSDTDGGTDFNPVDDAYQSDSLADLPVRNLTSPAITLQSPIPQRPIPPAALQPGGPQNSRFHEHGIGISPTPGNGMLPDDHNPWPDPLPEQPTPVANAPPSPGHQPVYDLPLGYIPAMDSDGQIRLPPSHEIDPPPASPQPVLIPPPGVTRDRSNSNASAPSAPGDYPYPKPQTPSVAESLQSIPASQSTTMSQFDLVNPPLPMQQRNFSGDRRQALSTIQEVPGSADFTPRHSPSVDRSGLADAQSPTPGYGGMPEPLVFPGVPQVRVEAGDSPVDQGRSPSRTPAENARLADTLRWGHPDVADEMRRSGSEIRSNPSIGSLPRQRPAHLTTPAPLAPQAPPANPHRPPSVTSARSSGTPQAHLLDPSYIGGSARGSQMRPSPSRLSSAGSPIPSASSHDYNIEIISPSVTTSSISSPRRQPTLGMLSPDLSSSDLPPPVVQPMPTVPTAPSTPSQGRYQSLGIMPEPSRTPGGTFARVNTLPPGFVPSAPPSPRPADPQLQATPRSNPMSLYGPPAGGAPRLQRSDSTSSSTSGGYPKPMHIRSRSMGQQPSLESFRSKTPQVRPPSSAGGGVPIYQGAPQPPGGYPVPPPGRNPTDSPQSTRSRKSGHERSRSMYAGSTPAPPSRPLSTAPVPVPDPAHTIRRPASVASNDSGMSGMSRGSKRSYKHYDPREDLDPAFLASTEELPLSPHTQANTRANAARLSTPGPGSRNSQALSYLSAGDSVRY